MEQTRRAVHLQPEWLARVPRDRRLPSEPTVHTGCGTSFHAAQTAGRAVQALDAVLAQPEADVMVAVSHEGTTHLTLQALREFDGRRWVVTGKADSPIAHACDEVVVATPAVEESWCHTASYTCAVAALAALRGDDIGWLPDAVQDVLDGERLPVSDHERWLVAGAGRDWPTAQEAALKLREGCFVACEAHQTEQLLHGHLAAVDESVRCLVYEGDGRAAERARDAVGALEELGCQVTLIPTRHPVVDIVHIHLLVLDLAAARGVNPDRIHRDDARWARAAERHGGEA
jgi:glucosamine--fructose-6-phosphate aminotransferase (isomerizing)